MNHPSKSVPHVASATAATVTAKDTVQQQRPQESAHLEISSVICGRKDPVVGMGAGAAVDEVGVAGSKLAQVTNGKLIQIVTRSVGLSP